MSKCPECGSPNIAKTDEGYINGFYVCRNCQKNFKKISASAVKGLAFSAVSSGLCLAAIIIRAGTQKK